MNYRHSRKCPLSAFCNVWVFWTLLHSICDRVTENMSVFGISIVCLVLHIGDRYICKDWAVFDYHQPPKETGSPVFFSSPFLPPPIPSLPSLIL